MGRGRHIFYWIGQLNWGLMFLILFLFMIGMMMQYSAGGGHLDPWARSHLIRFFPAFVGMLVIAYMPPQWLLKLAYPLYGIGVLMLVAVEVSGHIGMGAQRWIALGPVNLQPSELMKLGIIVVLARYFHTFHPNEKPHPMYLLIPLILLAIPAALILKQPNLGTAFILLVVGAIVLFVAGVRWIYFIIAGAGALIALPVAWQFLHDYQKQRVLTFLNPDQDPLGAGYNIIQSIIAIGSGGLFGKGYLKGSQGQLDFLPEKQTDFIFTMLAEEFGFVGCLVVILSYLLLLVFCIGIALRSRHRFGALIAVGIGALLFLHVLINIGMSMGLLPVVGVPLPLLSYGGTMLITIFLAFGLLMNVWIHRDVTLKVSSL